MDPSHLKIPSRFVKYDAALGLILGFAIVCKTDGQPYTDLHGDHIPEESMIEAAVEYMRTSRESRDNHGRAKDGETVFAFPYTQETADALGLGVEVHKSGLLVGMIPSKDVLTKVERGEYTGLSIGGVRVVDEPVDDDEIGKSLDAFVKAATPTPSTLAKASARKRNVMRKFRLHEISPVKRPAQEGAVIAPFLKWYDEDGTKVPVLTTDTLGHAHLIDSSANGGDSSYATAEGEEYGHTHPWVRSPDGSIVIGASAGHTHEIVTTKGADPAPDTAPAPAPLKENAMDPKDKEIETLKADNATLRAELAKAAALATLTDAHRAHAARLDAPARDAFVAKSAAERDTIVAAALAADPPVYTDAATGRTIRKSDDPTGLLVEVLKSRDEMAARLASEATAREDAEFAKRATVEMANLPGTEAVKVEVLRQIGRIKDDEVRKGATDMIHAANSQMAGLYVRKGASGGSVVPGAAPTSAADRLDAKASEIAKSRGVSFEKAMAEYLDTDEGARLYAQSEAEARQARILA